MRVLLLALAVLFAPAAVAAPDGFRQSPPLTARAVALSGVKELTVHCAATRTVYAVSDPATADSLGRIDRETMEIELPPATCAPMERWLKGKKVELWRLGEALFTLTHEVGHGRLNTSNEEAADCYAARRFNAAAKLFGVKSAATLRTLRISAQIPYFCTR